MRVTIAACLRSSLLIREEGFGPGTFEGYLVQTNVLAYLFHNYCQVKDDKRRT